MLLCGVAGGAVALECPAIQGAEPLLRPGTVLLLGELHGTDQSPGFVGDLSCLAIRSGLPLTVALEWPREEGAAVERFLGAAGDELAAPATDLWQRDYQDGRSSAAMLRLLVRVRSLSREGDLQVLLLDDRRPGPERDRTMAERLAAAAREKPERLLVALTGNLHSRLTLGSPFNADFRPMGLFVREALDMAGGERVWALDVAHRGGEAWICTDDEAGHCGVQRMRATDDGETPAGIELFPIGEGGAFSGRYHVGALTASPPARSNG